jgi:hypothetical protein
MLCLTTGACVVKNMLAMYLNIASIFLTLHKCLWSDWGYRAENFVRVKFQWDYIIYYISSSELLWIYCESTFTYFKLLFHHLAHRFVYVVLKDISNGCYTSIKQGESNWRIMKNNEEKNPKLLFVLFYVLFITILCI